MSIFRPEKYNQNRLHRLQPFETAGLSSCISTLERAKSRTSLDLTNKVGEENISTSPSSFLL
jgi:hypothetical protein